MKQWPVCFLPVTKFANLGKLPNFIAKECFDPGDVFLRQTLCSVLHVGVSQTLPAHKMMSEKNKITVSW